MEHVLDQREKERPRWEAVVESGEELRAHQLPSRRCQ